MTSVMTRAAFARLMGVHRSRVTVWVQAGMPVGADGLVDPEQAAEWVHVHVDPSVRLRHARRGAHLRSIEAAKALKRIPCLGHLEEPSDAALVAVLPMLMYAMPAAVICLAVSCGSSVEAAFTLFRASKFAVMQAVTELLDKLEVPPPPGLDSWDGADLFDPDGFDQLNWPSLAAQAGVPLDLAACQAFSDRCAAEHFRSDEETTLPKRMNPGAKGVSSKRKLLQ